MRIKDEEKNYDHEQNQADDAPWSQAAGPEGGSLSGGSFLLGFSRRLLVVLIVHGHLSKSMKILRALIALASLGLGIWATWSYFSGLQTGESSAMAVLALPTMLVGCLPTLLGLIVCMVVLMGRDILTLFRR